MKKKILIGSIIAVAIIVLSSFSSVVGKVSSDNELVEFDVEFCGLGKDHTVKLTQQQADQIELLFDDIKKRLSEVETREEAEIIFNEAVVELDKYRLLGKLSIEQAQKLVTKNSKQYEEYGNSIVDNNSNYLCLVAGNVNSEDIIFQGPIMRIINVISAYITLRFLWGDIPILQWFFDNLPIICFSILPIVACLTLLSMGLLFISSYLTLLNDIRLSHYGSVIGIGESGNTPAGSWIYSFGINGAKSWIDDFRGNLQVPPIYMSYITVYWTVDGGLFYPGISFFTGLRITRSSAQSDFFMGFSPLINIKNAD